MPIYEYEISETGERYEVMHSIHDELKTWGDLAKLLKIEVGPVGADTPISRIMAGRVFVNGNLEDLSKGKVIQKEKP